MRGLGASTYETAQYVVAVLQDNDLESAVALLSAHTPDEIVLVGKKAIALGADPATVNMLVQALATGETIEIVDSKPVIKPKRPWWHYALAIAGGAAVVGGSVYAYRRWGAPAMRSALTE